MAFCFLLSLWTKRDVTMFYHLQRFVSLVVLHIFIGREWLYSPTSAFVLCQTFRINDHGKDSSGHQMLLRMKNNSIQIKSLKRFASSSNNLDSSFINALVSRDQEKLQRPPDPTQFFPELSDNINLLLEWWKDKKYVVCLTGAGLSTESGLQDYRGHNGAYHNGHKPMVHDDFMKSESSRKRYWGRSMVGWRNFDSSLPNMGHDALTKLEQLGKIGVPFDDKITFYSQENQDDFYFSSGTQILSILTQNVDSLHRRSGTKYVTELHGRGDLLKCTTCGSNRNRNDFHDELEDMNHEWMEQINNQQQEQLVQDEEEEEQNSNRKSIDYLRPDGDGEVVLKRTYPNENDPSSTTKYASISIPSCQKCHDGFMKPDVVFFGDSVPKDRVAKGMAAVQASNGLLCIGSSLTVPSAFQFVRYAAQIGVPIAILNVGETRAETDATLSRFLSSSPTSSITKIEAPAGPSLMACANYFEKESNI